MDSCQHDGSGAKNPCIDCEKIGTAECMFNAMVSNLEQRFAHVVEYVRNLPPDEYTALVGLLDTFAAPARLADKEGRLKTPHEHLFSVIAMLAQTGFSTAFESITQSNIDEARNAAKGDHRDDA